MAVKVKPMWDPPLLSEWMESVDENVQWLVEGFIPEEAYVLLSGQQKKAYKTWFAMLLGLCVASGQHQVGFKPTRGAPVLFIEEEGTKAPTKSRFKWLSKTLGIQWETDLPNFRFAFRNFVRLDQKEWISRLQDYKKRHKPGLIIIDALNRVHGGDENSTQEMDAVMDAVQMLKGDGCSILLLAHLNKSKGSNPKADHDDQVRGAGVITTNYDTHIALRRYTDNQSHIDCYLQHRDEEWNKYSLGWDIDKEAGTAKLNMMEVVEDAGAKYDKLLSVCKNKLTVDQLYSDSELKDLFAIDWKLAQKIATDLGMVKAKGKWVI